MIGKKITIEGNKVQDVGYRLFLLDNAERILITHLDARNLKKELNQEVGEKVEVLIGGDKDRVEKFIKFVQNNFPENADVNCPIDDAENYEGDIRTIESFSRCLSVHQLAKFATIGNKIVIGQEMLRTDTNKNFRDIDIKYKLISDSMFAIVNEMKETSQLPLPEGGGLSAMARVTVD